MKKKIKNQKKNEKSKKIMKKKDKSFIRLSQV